MKYYTFPDTDLKISQMTLGTWVFGGKFWGGANERDCEDAVRCALEMGIHCIDTAPIYGNGVSEKIVGRALKGIRDRAVIATKCGLTAGGSGIAHNLKPESIRREVEDSLRRLQTDVIDLYQCHWPDQNTPIEETMRELYRLKEEGKIRYIGLSNFGRDLFEQALALGPVISSQNQYSLVERDIEKDLLPFLKERRVGLLAYGPLAGGILTGKYKTRPQFQGVDARTFFYQNYEGDAFEAMRQLLARLRRLERPLNQLAINWVRAQGGVASVLVGCRNPRQVEDNIAAWQWELDAEELRTIEDILGQKTHG